MCLGSWSLRATKRPIGRASEALRTELPDVFPEFVFDFIDPEGVELELD